MTTSGSVQSAMEWTSHPLYVEAIRRHVLPGGRTEYAVPRPLGTTADDVTDFMPGQDWSDDNLPLILYEFRPSLVWRLFRDSPKPAQKRDTNGRLLWERWCEEGQEREALLDFEILPDKIGTDENEYVFEAWKRLDPRIRWIDITMRMEHPRPNGNAIQTRLWRKYRPHLRILSWDNMRHNTNQNPNEPQIRAQLSPKQISNNTTRGLTPGLINPALGAAGGRISYPEILRKPCGILRGDRAPRGRRPKPTKRKMESDESDENDHNTKKRRIASSKIASSKIASSKTASSKRKRTGRQPSAKKQSKKGKRSSSGWQDPDAEYVPAGEDRTARSDSEEAASSHEEDSCDEDESPEVGDEYEEKGEEDDKQAVDVNSNNQIASQEPIASDEQTAFQEQIEFQERIVFQELIEIQERIVFQDQTAFQEKIAFQDQTAFQEQLVSSEQSASLQKLESVDMNVLFAKYLVGEDPTDNWYDTTPAKTAAHAGDEHHAKPVVCIPIKDEEAQEVREQSGQMLDWYNDTTTFPDIEQSPPQLFTSLWMDEYNYGEMDFPPEGGYIFHDDFLA